MASDIKHLLQSRWRSQYPGRRARPQAGMKVLEPWGEGPGSHLPLRDSGLPPLGNF